MRKWHFSIMAALLCCASAASAYDVVEVKNGGSIEGVVEFVGTAPKDPVLKLSSETAYCGKTMAANKYVIKDGKIENVAVYITDIKSGKAMPAEPVKLTNLKCEFVPHMSIGYQGGKLIQGNDDPIFHNIHTYLNGKTMFNIGLPEKGSSVTKPLLRPGQMEVTCDSHPWMHGFLMILDNPYGAVSAGNGGFAIKDIPAGTYTIEAWHEALGKVTVANVKVEAGKATKIKVEFKK
jgi:hypothetical protein